MNLQLKVDGILYRILQDNSIEINLLTLTYKYFWSAT